MGGFKIIEDRPTPKSVYNARVYIQAAIYSCGALTFGYDAAFFGTTVARKSFKSDYNITNNQTIANLTSVYLAGAFFGAIFAWPAMERFGRRIPLQVASLVFIVGAILMTVATHQIGLQYAGRVITGCSVGVLTAVIPTAISELAPNAIRGQLVGGFEVCYQAGSLVGFWINYGITKNMVDSRTAWRIPMAIQLVPGGLLGIGTLFLKESPAWLLRRGRDEEALAILSWLRKLPADHKYIQEEVGMTHAVMDEESQISGGQRGMAAYVRGAFSQLKIDHVRHRIIVVFWMFMFQNYSGALIINYYSPIIFQSIGIASGDVAFYTGIYGLVKAVGSFIFFILIIDRSGRRNPWLLSATVCALCLLYIGVYVNVAHPAVGKIPSASAKAGGNAAMFFLFLYSLVWSFGGNGLPWIVSAEMFPISLRSLTGAFAACCQWLASFSATMAAAQLQAKLKHGLFYFFAAICLATAIFTFIWVPDTKGVPLECMPILFSGKGRHAQWRQKKLFPPNGIPEFPAEVALAPHKSTGSIHDKDGVDAQERAHIERSVV